MKDLFFVRHGQTEWNATGRMQGQRNSDLNDLGRKQADINGRLLADLDIAALFASPLDRTRQTAEIVNQYLSLPVTYDDRIVEWDCGDWSGQLREEVKVKWAEEWAAFQADPYHFRGFNCETYPDMVERATPFLAELKALRANRIAIISHGMIGKVMVSILLGLKNHEAFEFHQANDKIFQVTLDGNETMVRHYVAGAGPFDGIDSQP